MLTAAFSATLPLLLLIGTDAGWSEPAEVNFRRDVVVTYRARLDGDVLVVEASHKDGWHTYAMDNIERARQKSGREKPETELPTKISVSGALEVVGDWRQTPPKDLSMTEIKWYTWGFEGKSRFAAKVRRTSGDGATVKIEGQACNASSCAMVDTIEITLPVPETLSENSDALADLVAVKLDAANETK